jgi:hypothetical protein
LTDSEGVPGATVPRNELAAHHALGRLADVYARGVDRRDPELIKSVFHPDAIEDHGTYFCGNAHDFAERIPAIMAAFTIASHFISNRLFAVEGDYAEGELYLLSTTISAERPDYLYMIGGRYLDRYEKRDDVWKIAHRRLAWDWASEAPVAKGALAVNSLGIVGRPGPDDLSYAHFRLLSRPPRDRIPP